MKKISILLLLCLLGLPAYTGAPVGAWWFTNFDYRYQISIPAGASILPTGYSIPITFDHAAAVAAGHSLASGDDVRIVRWTGAAWVDLDRVIDPDSGWNSATTTLWFKTQAAIGTGVTDDNYYLYYGDLTAGTPLQNGGNVFSLYDDFESGFDATLWNRSNNTNVTVAGGVLTVNGGRQIRSVATFGINTIFEVRSLVANLSPSNPNYYLAGDNDCSNYTFDSYIRFRADNTASDAVQVSPGTTNPAAGAFTATSATSFQLYSFTREAAGAGRFIHNGTQVGTYTGATTTAMCMFMRNEAGTTTHTQQYEWARVRSYRNPEPVPSLAALETLPMPTVAGDWHFDQTSWTGAAGEVLDSGPNGLHMTSYAGANTAIATPAIGGDPGTCRYGVFSGTSQYAQVADNAALDLPNQVTVTVWVYPRSLPGAGSLKSIWSKDTNYEMHLNSSGQVDWWWGGGAQELITTGTPVPLNQWSHIAVTYQSGMQRIYINGVLRASQATVGTLTVNALPFQIGQDQGIAERFWNGYIDETRVYGAALSKAQVNSVMTQTRPCSSAHHFLIGHSGFGITCAAVQNVTVTVHDSVHNAVTSYNNQITLDTQTGRGTWTLVSGAGTFVDATANDGLATYQWPSGQSTATFALDYRSATPPSVVPPGVLSMDIDAYETANPALRDDDTEGPMVFSPSGFVVTSSALSNPPPNPIPAFASPQIAGTNFNAYITAYGQTPTDPTCGVIEGYTGVHSLKFWPAYVNPNTGTRGLSVNGGTSGTNEAGATVQNVTFTAGQSNAVTTQYKDAGQIGISVKDDTTGNPGLPTGIRGSSNVVVKPSTFGIAIKRTDNNAANPAAAAATDPVFIPAGQAFTVAVTALDSAGATTPNFGIETPAESVRLTAALVLPSGGQMPALTGSFSSVASGVITGTNFAWGEVGIISVTPRLNDGSYLGGGDVVGSAVNVGRFIPFNFGVTPNVPSVAPDCTGSGYVYIGESLKYATAPVLSLTARAVGGGTTQNYQGAFFKLTNTSSTGRNYTTSSGTLNQTGLPANDPAALSLGNGLATLTFNTNAGIFYVRSTPVVPFTPVITLSLNVFDTDGVAASTNAALLSTNPFVIGNPAGIATPEHRYGRIAFRNAVGSELLNLPVSMHAEYFQSTTAGFVQSVADNCTTGVTVSLTNFAGNLSAGETCLVDSGSPGASGAGCAVAGVVGQRFSMPPTAGDFIAILRAPGAGNDGTVTIDTVVPSWLQFDWKPAIVGLENPSAVVNFGLFKGEAKRIFQIEK